MTNNTPAFTTENEELTRKLEKLHLEFIDLFTRHKDMVEIEFQSAQLDEAKKVLSHLISEEDALKLKEIFRVLCKRLHPDLNPHQTEEEKDLFIKVKAAYDLQKLTDLQTILLYLDDSNREKLTIISGESSDPEKRAE